ncbi:hypothetical protein F2Q69_00018251 [Brassica cretica]|uniref:RNase H type-1 domain-containing protein n=1 Tax=Brassica cretica TaxID=69181 RepID=A0A8S9PXV8_BRACR|nr:hypothetical protein F2Q69_00018251 [Brassica cretica]
MVSSTSIGWLMSPTAGSSLLLVTPLAFGSEDTPAAPVYSSALGFASSVLLWRRWHLSPGLSWVAFGGGLMVDLFNLKTSVFESLKRCKWWRFHLLLSFPPSLFERDPVPRWGSCLSCFLAVRAAIKHATSLNFDYIWLRSYCKGLIQSINARQRSVELFGVLADSESLIRSSFSSFQAFFVPRSFNRHADSYAKASLFDQKRLTAVPGDDTRYSTSSYVTRTGFFISLRPTLHVTMVQMSCPPNEFRHYVLSQRIMTVPMCGASTRRVVQGPIIVFSLMSGLFSALLLEWPVKDICVQHVVYTYFVLALIGYLGYQRPVWPACLFVVALIIASAFLFYGVLRRDLPKPPEPEEEEDYKDSPV